MNIIKIILPISIAALAVGCNKQIEKESPVLGMANPASVHCLKQGGQLEIGTRKGGGQMGICQFNDDSSCEEWAFYRNECRKGEHTK